MNIPHLRPFLLGIFGWFIFSWLCIVVFPWSTVGHLQPLKTDDGIAPWDMSGLAHAGERVYAVNGCVYCHTQQVRDGSAGADLIRGWGTGRGSDGKEQIKRRSYPRDYIWQNQVFLGNSRFGADLSNVGARFADANALYCYLYYPYELNPNCSMPAYHFLFQMRKIEGHPSDEALKLSGDQAAPEGYEIVPTADARALVAYLLSLNKGYKLPVDESNAPAPTSTEE